MSTIIAAKYGGPCIKCGKKIKAGSFVNWDRRRGIWHLDETDNKKLGSSMLDPTAQEIGDGCHPDTHHREEEVMGSDGTDGTININDLIKALQGMTETDGSRVIIEKEVPVEVIVKAEPSEARKLTDKQTSFCELMALGSNRADAYTDSYDVGNAMFSNNAARKLLENKKIRDKIAEFRNYLGDKGTKGGSTDFYDAVKSTGATGGWAFKVTENQEKFCQAMASGATILEAFKKSGYAASNWTEKRMRRDAGRLMKLAKVRVRITSLASGDTFDVEPVVAGGNSHKTPRPPAQAKESVEADQQPEVSEQLSVINGEFVDNFIELIKAHGRLVHHAIVTRGQKEVGIPGVDVKGMEEAVCRSLETLRDALSDKLSKRPWTRPSPRT